MEGSWIASLFEVAVGIGAPALIVVAGFALVWSYVQHLRPDGPTDRGLRVWTCDLDPSLVAALSRLPEAVDWDDGWARRDGDVLLLLARPKFLQGPFWAPVHRPPFPYVAAIQLDAAAPTLACRVPWGGAVIVAIGVGVSMFVLLPFVVLLAWGNHTMQLPTLEAALRSLAAGRIPGAEGEPTAPRTPASPPRSAYSHR